MDIKATQVDVWADSELITYNKHDPLRYAEVSFAALCENLFQESRNPDVVQKFIFYLAKIGKFNRLEQSRISALAQFFLELGPVPKEEIIIIKYLNKCKINDIMSLYGFKSRNSIYQCIEKYNTPQYLRKIHINHEDMALINRLLEQGERIMRICI